MKLSDFDFYLPQELIAQHPAPKRDQSNLLIAPLGQDFLITKFSDLSSILKAGDLLVFNDTKVMKARILFEYEGKSFEFLLNNSLDNKLVWRAFARNSRYLREGQIFNFDSHQIILNKKLDTGLVEIEFKLNKIDLQEFLSLYGTIPLPPYIKRASSAALQEEEFTLDEERYQTVYSKKLGAIAAPTAGLHFSKSLLEQLKDKGIEQAYITLHVGAGTFLPVKTDNIDKHIMHEEYYAIDDENAELINRAVKDKRRIIAVGTTVLRALESAARKASVLKEGESRTDIFIRPGFSFKLVDMLITNFHLPKSTLYMLVCAFSGYDKMRSLYQYAIENRMRFFSYGDACLIYRS